MAERSEIFMVPSVVGFSQVPFSCWFCVLTVAKFAFVLA